MTWFRDGGAGNRCCWQLKHGCHGRPDWTLTTFGTAWTLRSIGASKRAARSGLPASLSLYGSNKVYELNYGLTSVPQKIVLCIRASPHERLSGFSRWTCVILILLEEYACTPPAPLCFEMQDRGKGVVVKGSRDQTTSL